MPFATCDVQLSQDTSTLHALQHMVQSHRINDSIHKCAARRAFVPAPSHYDFITYSGKYKRLQLSLASTFIITWELGSWKVHGAKKEAATAAAATN